MELGSRPQRQETAHGHRCVERRPAAAHDVDVALLKLSGPVDLQPIQLADSAPVGLHVRLLGWGGTHPRGANPDGTVDLPKRLQQLDTTIVASENCASAGITEGEFCTDNPHGDSGPAPGDSGGPAIIVKDGVRQVAGLCSRATSLLPGVDPTVYTDLTDAGIRKWIFDTARAN